ncbi:MAG: NAD(P)/FAD-dependent oxidoreductase [Phycisphaerae bacterium]|nr:NAD(P)/FAD-dependent oxidoreductase [Phycisphaerae bacterium]
MQRGDSPSAADRFDVIILGGGPAGLSAAVVLARCRRQVLVLDAGKPRNHAARGIHNYLTRDGIPPARFRAAARAEAVRYGANVIAAKASDAKLVRDGFRVRVERRWLHATLLLVATGVVDLMPDIPGAQELYGQCLHHCPYCDAWEYRDKPLAVIGNDKRGFGLASSLLTWTNQVTVVTNGGDCRASIRRDARRLGIGIRTERIAECVTTTRGSRRRLRSIAFESGPPLRASGIFFNTGQLQRCTFPRSLGCRIGEDGGVLHDRRQRTGVPGLYLAGDAAKEVQFAIVAAAEGATAAVAMNAELQRRALAARRT